MFNKNRFTTLKFPQLKDKILFFAKVFSLMIFGGFLMFLSTYYDSLVLIFVELALLYLIFIAIVIPTYKNVKIYFFDEDYIRIYDATIWGKKNEKRLTYTNITSYWQLYNINRLILKDDENNSGILVKPKLHSFDFIIENITKHQYSNYLQKIKNNQTVVFKFHDFENYKALANSPNAESYFQNTKNIEMNLNYLKIDTKTYSWNDVKEAKANLSYNIKVLHYFCDEIQYLAQIENYDILDKLLTDLQDKAPVVYIK
ncbi:hypothetical protein [Soonwooa sp.]|uniref:hypothetical protein n=1 Tax=Soonwooa sp. TaxID=1938592 RepID=UPI002632F2A9|nr:hypothetical protein [Soonwooa sp.]